MIKKKIHETETEVIYEIEEIVPLEKNDIYNTTYLAESIICMVKLDNNIFAKYLYKEKKSEIIKDIKSVTIEFATNYGNKEITYANIDCCSIEMTNSFDGGHEIKLSFKY